MKELLALAAIFALAITFYIFGFVAGEGYGKQAERKAAVEAGVGHYSCDPTTGKISWEWK